MTTIAFIAVRGGSKSIPKKNIKPLAGKPLVYWAARAAQRARGIDQIVISTDSPKIGQVVRQFDFDKVKIYARDPAFAADTSSTESAMLEYIQAAHLPPEDIFVLLQATSPLIRAEHIDGMIARWRLSGADSALSVVRNKRFFWTADGRSMNYDFRHRPRRQDFEGMWMENGACYISRVRQIVRSGNRLSGKICLYEMPAYTAVEIDEPEDFLLAEQIMEKHRP